MSTNSTKKIRVNSTPFFRIMPINCLQNSPPDTDRSSSCSGLNHHLNWQQEQELTGPPSPSLKFPQDCIQSGHSQSSTSFSIPCPHLWLLNVPVAFCALCCSVRVPTTHVWLFKCQPLNLRNPHPSAVLTVATHMWLMSHYAILSCQLKVLQLTTLPHRPQQ